MSDYELVSMALMLGLNFIFTMLTVNLKNSILRFFFLLLLVYSIPLTIGVGNEIITLNNGAGTLNDLAALLTTGYSVSIFVAITITGYLMIVLIQWAVTKFRNSFKKPSNDIDVIDEAVQ